jgi:hypothetical protein
LFWVVVARIFALVDIEIWVFPLSLSR